MKEFTITKNTYLEQDIKAYYSCDYVGYRKDNNPDFVNNLKNMSGNKSELDLVKDFVLATEKITKDFKQIIDKEGKSLVVVTIPRSKSEKHYKQSQLMFKKVISCIAKQLKLVDGTDTIKRVKDTQTTHDWHMENNKGKQPYHGITKDTCEIDKSKIEGKNILLVDDIYTHGVNIAEDCIQHLLNLGAKNVILYVVAKTRS